MTISPCLFSFFITLEPRVERYQSLCALYTSPPRTCPYPHSSAPGLGGWVEDAGFGVCRGFRVEDLGSQVQGLDQMQQHLEESIHVFGHVTKHIDGFGNVTEHMDVW